MSEQTYKCQHCGAEFTRGEDPCAPAQALPRCPACDSDDVKRFPEGLWDFLRLLLRPT